jgi:hypothetical protein
MSFDDLKPIQGRQQEHGQPIRRAQMRLILLINNSKLCFLFGGPIIASTYYERKLMGLDNIPKHYPCKTQGTAVLVHRLDNDENPVYDENGEAVTSIDCEQTQAAGGCPWKNANPPIEGHVLGMFGTDCWYRGKYGNRLLEEATDNDSMGDNLSFYGDEEDGTVKSASSCIATADLCRLAWNSYEPEEAAAEETAEIIAGLQYAEWYLRWAAETTDGLICWY